jgi:hypothetical protein
MSTANLTEGENTMPFDEAGVAGGSRKDQLLFLVDKIDQLLDTPEHWCKHSLATDDHGFPLNFMAPNATRFCMTGAINRVCFDNNMIGFEPALTVLFNKVPWPVGISAMNDYYETDFSDIKMWIASVRSDLEKKPQA